MLRNENRECPHLAPLSVRLFSLTAVSPPFVPFPGPRGCSYTLTIVPLLSVLILGFQEASFASYRSNGQAQRQLQLYSLVYIRSIVMRCSLPSGAEAYAHIQLGRLHECTQLGRWYQI